MIQAWVVHCAAGLVRGVRHELSIAVLEPLQRLIGRQVGCLAGGVRGSESPAPRARLAAIGAQQAQPRRLRRDSVETMWFPPCSLEAVSGQWDAGFREVSLTSLLVGHLLWDLAF